MGVASVRQVEIVAHRQAMRSELPVVVGRLRELLTPTLVAVIGGVKETRATREWAEGRRGVSAETGRRLRDALQATLLVSEAFDAATARAWMVGMDPLLADRSPAAVLREGGEDGRRRVLASARRFASQ